MILPCEDPALRAEATKRPYSRIGRFDQLPQDVEMGVCRIIQHEVDLMRRIQIIVRDLEHCCDFSVQAAFRDVDVFSENKIHVQNLIEFMRRHASYMQPREALAVIRRIDTDGDAAISFAEFADFI